MNIRTRVSVAIAATSLSALALAGCAATTSTGSTSAGTGTSSSSPAAAAPSSTPSASSVLATSSTSLGKVVVDGTGMTVYVFDKDTKGATMSACTGSCTGLWPAVETTSATPKVTGVTGTVGTITGTDGKLQVTLDGLPLYTYSGDSAAGDTTGQGVGGIWWAVGADGAKVTAAGTTSSTSGY